MSNCIKCDKPAQHPIEHPTLCDTHIKCKTDGCDNHRQACGGRYKQGRKIEGYKSYCYECGPKQPRQRTRKGKALCKTRTCDAKATLPTALPTLCDDCIKCSTCGEAGRHIIIREYNGEDKLIKVKFADQCKPCMENPKRGEKRKREETDTDEKQDPPLPELTIIQPDTIRSDTFHPYTPDDISSDIRPDQIPGTIDYRVHRLEGTMMELYCKDVELDNALKACMKKQEELAEIIRMQTDMIGEHTQFINKYKAIAKVIADFGEL